VLRKEDNDWVKKCKKGRGRTLNIVPRVHCHCRGAQVHGAHQAASHISALYLMKKCMEYEVEGALPRGRPKKTWREIVENDFQACKLIREDAVDHN